MGHVHCASNGFSTDAGAFTLDMNSGLLFVFKSIVNGNVWQRYILSFHRPLYRFCHADLATLPLPGQRASAALNYYGSRTPSYLMWFYPLVSCSGLCRKHDRRTEMAVADVGWLVKRLCHVGLTNFHISSLSALQI